MLIYLALCFIAVFLWHPLGRLRCRIGARIVARLLAQLPSDEYIVLNNAILKTEGRRPFIFHVVLSVYGVFIIEDKYYSGVISGDVGDERWTQRLKGLKRTFPNPIIQNEGNLKAARSRMGKYSSVPVFSLVAFSDEAELRVNEDERLVFWSRLVERIRSRRDVVLTMDQVRELKDIITGDAVN